MSHTEPIVHRCLKPRSRGGVMRRDKSRKDYISWCEFKTALGRAVVNVGWGSSHLVGGPFRCVFESVAG